MLPWLSERYRATLPMPANKKQAKATKSKQ
jgi:hypothetical protein